MHPVLPWYPHFSQGYSSAVSGLVVVHFCSRDGESGAQDRSSHFHLHCKFCSVSESVRGLG